MRTRRKQLNTIKLFALGLICLGSLSAFGDAKKTGARVVQLTLEVEETARVVGALESKAVGNLTVGSASWRRSFVSVLQNSTTHGGKVITTEVAAAFMAGKVDIQVGGQSLIKVARNLRSYPKGTTKALAELIESQKVKFGKQGAFAAIALVASSAGARPLDEKELNQAVRDLAVESKAKLDDGALKKFYLGFRGFGSRGWDKDTTKKALIRPEYEKLFPKKAKAQWDQLQADVKKANAQVKTDKAALSNPMTTEEQRAQILNRAVVAQEISRTCDYSRNVAGDSVDCLTEKAIGVGYFASNRKGLISRRPAANFVARVADDGLHHDNPFAVKSGLRTILTSDNASKILDQKANTRKRQCVLGEQAG